MSLPVLLKNNYSLYGESSIRNFYGYRHKSENIPAIPEKQPHIFSFEGFRI
jgi:hypothetical protein